MNKKHVKRYIGIAVCLLSLVAVFSSCNPEAEWETENVKLNMTINKVSAGFVECSFSTNKDAYYLIAIMEPWEDYNPVANQKQFMQLVLDSAYAEYLFWRNDLLRAKEFNVAPFSSHSLQYGDTQRFFTGLLPESDYWIVAFVVDPVAMKPASQLVFENVKTTAESVMDVHFDYRVKGLWDYIYPVDTLGKIHDNFPYIATTRDSLTLVHEGITTDEGAVTYFAFWTTERFLFPELANVTYGVHAVENNGVQSSELFKEGHIYYTAISGYDGSFKQTTVYKFKWTGANCDLYFKDTDPANIAVWIKEIIN